MATPLSGDGLLALMPQELADPSAETGTAEEKKLMAAGGVQGQSAEKWPILIFVYFHKAIRAELDRLHRAAVKLATDGSGDVQKLAERCRFVHDVYKHHCNAEDAVIFPALDIRVKNVARTYSLEHKGERDLFDKLIETFQPEGDYDKFRRELASWTGAIQRLLSQHMSKEEEQVFPLLMEKFSFEEQAVLVWQFLCSIPVNTMTEFLHHLSACVSVDEHQDLINCLRKIVPMEKLLQQVIFSWLEERGTTNKELTCDSDLEYHGCQSHSGTDQIEHDHSIEKSGIGKRKHKESDSNVIEDSAIHPINEILLWHNAIRKELNDITEEARKIQLCGDFSDLSTFNMKLQFIADVCIFHSIAEDEVIFPAVNVSFTEEHKDEASQLRHLIEEIQNVGVNSTSAEFYSSLCSQADQIVERIQNHFRSEEAEVLPLARMKFSAEKQRKLLFKSICVMPLKLLECVLPWFVAKLSDDEARSFLQNIHLAASSSEAALVTLFSGWACKSRQNSDVSDLGNFKCLTPRAVACSSLEEDDEHEEDRNIAYCACACPLSCTSSLSTKNCSNRCRPVKRGNFTQFSGLDGRNMSDSFEFKSSSCVKGSCCVPGLGAASSSGRVSSQASTKSLYSVSYSSFAPSLNSSLFDGDTDLSCSTGNTVRPIDTIFKFHKAIRKDVTYLDDESGKLIKYKDAPLREFNGRFRLLWGLYKGHSNAEDDVVFPALESRETLHNVSHSYTLDHKQEEKLFEDISKMLSELSHLHEILHTATTEEVVNIGDSDLSFHGTEWTRKWNEIVTELQGMCRSLHVTLDNHVSREEVELWPLFDKHVSVEEQEKLVGRIIGMTGAEVLQSMLPWVTSALELEEQNEMMDTWRQAAKNTMFNDWLSQWWEVTPVTSQEARENFALLEGAYQEESLDQSDQMFKPGWKDIFRMNQNELESEIRKVSQDPKLDPRRKAYLIQNLMTSRWIAAQQKLPKRSDDATDGTSASENSPSFRDPEKKIFGCEHYKRNCKLLAVCCNKLFTCRFCHDKISDHSMDRKATKEMMCMRCLQIQPIAATCKTPSCSGFSMANYYCNICKFFDDERNVYHCPFCNLCRVGRGLGIDFFHCMKCNCCLGMKLQDHKCRENSLETNCPICCDFLFTSSEAVRALPCGHYMHSKCFRAYTCTHYTCPICCKSLGDMAVYFGMLDALLAAEELPEEYRNRCQNILCNDCEKKGIARFHWLYHKCSFCGSYNTRVIKTENADCSTSNR